MGKKRGAKSWFEASNERKHELFEIYSRRYDEAKAKGFRLSAKKDFYGFNSIYSQMYRKGIRQNIIRSIIYEHMDSAVSKLQADTWSKMSKKLAKKDEKFKDFKDMSSLSFRKYGKSEDFWALVSSLGGFKKVVYVDD